MSYEEYLKLKEIAEDYEDLKALREAKEEEKKKIFIGRSKENFKYLNNSLQRTGVSDC